MTFTVEIPVPPSVNNIYANAGKRRVKTQTFAAWKREAAWTIAFEVPASKAIRGPVCIRLSLPCGTKGDIDNRLKAAIDALVASGRIDDDRNVTELHADRAGIGDKAVLIVTEGLDVQIWPKARAA